MNDGPNNNLSDEEAKALRALGHDVTPSPGLEDRIVSELKQRGQIRARGGIVMQTARFGVAAAVLAGVFVAGLAVGKRGDAAQVTQSAPVVATETPAGNQYMLLMFMRERGEAPAQPGAPATDKQKEAMRAIVSEYRDWAIAREGEGRLVGADKLADDIRVMTRAGGETQIVQAATDERILGGYFTITAQSLDEAVEIAKSHPHLKYGGEVEVRPIEITQ